MYIPKFEVRLNLKSFLLRYDQLKSSNVVKSRMYTKFQNPTGVQLDLKPSTCGLIPSKTSCPLSIGEVDLLLSMGRDGVWFDRGNRKERRLNTETSSISNPSEGGNGSIREGEAVGARHDLGSTFIS